MPPSRTDAAPAADLSQLAYERLRELIVHGRLAPGARLIEKDVAERLGMSRTPVRSALQRLTQEGYVATVSMPGRQPRLLVAALTREDALELFELLAELEGLAGKAAAQLPAERRGEVVAELERLNRELALLSQTSFSDLNQRFENDTQFHQVYVDAGAGPRLRTLHGFVKPQAERYIRVYISLLAGAGGASQREHEAVATAIAAGDAVAAQQAVQTNWRNAAARLSAVIEEAGGRGDWLAEQGAADSWLEAR